MLPGGTGDMAGGLRHNRIMPRHACMRGKRGKRRRRADFEPAYIRLDVA